jgi:hypothetical protein
MLRVTNQTRLNRTIQVSPVSGSTVRIVRFPIGPPLPGTFPKKAEQVLFIWHLQEIFPSDLLLKIIEALFRGLFSCISIVRQVA